MTLPAGQVAGGWLGDPLALAGITLLATVYAAMVRSLRHSAPNAVGRRHVIVFSLGLLALFVATCTPLEARVHGALSAHMAQHMLLIAVAAPLVAWGMPLTRFAAVLPARVRAAMASAERHLTRGSVAIAAALVLVVAGAHAFAVWSWHVPLLYEAALSAEWLHRLEHFAFFVTALAAWMVLLGFGSVARPSLLMPLGLFALAAQGAALGALMAFSGRSWYPVYGEGSGAVLDQQLAGLIMWGFGGAAPALAAFLLMVAWVERSRRYPSRPDPVVRSSRAVNPRAGSRQSASITRKVGSWNAKS